MIADKPPRLPTRERVLDAAEALLSQGSAAFSMRDLAEAAGVSFATPFNQFGSKAAIMLALSARRIALMQERFARATLPSASVARVLATIDIAAAVMLAAPSVNRAVMGAIGAPGEAAGDVSRQSAALWAEALGTGQGLAADTLSLGLATLPGQLAVAFRGVLSFWTAGEFTDRSLPGHARCAAAATLLGFAEAADRGRLLKILQAGSAEGGRTR